MNMLSADIKKVIGGDEYYSPQNVVDMIVPYILRGGVGKKYGVRSIKKRAYLCRHSKG